MSTPRRPTDRDYRLLLDFRDGLRRFIRWSEQQAKAAGLTPAQHQLLLAVRGHGSPPSIGEVADHLLLRHHSVVGLVDRCVAAGLVERFSDQADQRIVRVRLTPDGSRTLDRLGAAHLEELSRVRAQITPLWDDLPVDG